MANDQSALTKVSKDEWRGANCRVKLLTHEGRLRYLCYHGHRYLGSVRTLEDATERLRLATQAAQATT
jgi:hypothetical protein